MVAETFPGANNTASKDANNTADAPKVVANKDKILDDKKSVPKIGATFGTTRGRALRHMPAGKYKYPSAFELLNRPVRQHRPTEH